MSVEGRIKKISVRVEKFLDINSEVSVFDLKFHLNCPSSELLMALGILSAADKINIYNGSGGLRIAAREFSKS